MSSSEGDTDNSDDDDHASPTYMRLWPQPAQQQVQTSKTISKKHPEQTTNSRHQNPSLVRDRPRSSSASKSRSDPKPCKEGFYDIDDFAELDTSLLHLHVQEQEHYQPIKSQERPTSDDIRASKLSATYKRMRSSPGNAATSLEGMLSPTLDSEQEESHSAKRRRLAERRPERILDPASAPSPPQSPNRQLSPHRASQNADFSFSKGKFSTIRNMDSSGNDTDNGDGNDDQTSRTRTRVWSQPDQQHIKTSKTISRKRLKQAPHSRNQDPPLIRSRPRRSLALKSRSAAQSNANIRTSSKIHDSSSDDSVHHLASNKRKRNRRSEDKDNEYEVEMIVDARVNLKKLQYRVKWVGYDDDPVWYDAVNFKNSPHKLSSFHTANPDHIRPPKRLKMWAQCWEEDRDADDHPDDNKAERLNK